MMNRKGFTLIELMVVIFIVGILAAVAIPIMRGRIDSAKWSEGKSGAGSVRTAARAFVAEKGNTYNFAQYNGNFGAATTRAAMGFADKDLDGRYFKQTDYAIAFVNSAVAADPPTYEITVTATVATSPEAPASPASMKLDQDGLFTP
jgi:prepilin-type N-terminal cleavage/methylation domain-containing protein